MRKILFAILLITGLTVYTQEQDGSNPKRIASDISLHIQDHNIDDLHDLFNEDLKEGLNQEQLNSFLESLTQNYGDFEKVIDFTEKTIAEGTYYHQGLQYKKQKFDLIFSLDEDRKLSSFRLTAYSDKSIWKAPEYVNSTNYKVEAIKIGAQNPLIGEYTSAINTKESIIAVFVHGSGPNNMNGRLGPNELFKDLAYGLATNGISSIRYNKRSYDYPSALMKDINSLTIDDIVVNDAVDAIKKAKDLGAKKVILLGHSLGGHLAPKIANQVDVNGVIIMAGNSSPLEDLIIPQFEHIMKNDSTSGITDFQLNMIKQQINTLKSKEYDENTAGMALPFGLPGKYWMSLQDYNPVKLAKKHKFPYLILNGERDYQVTPEEAKNWKNGNKHQYSKTIIYPKLNHMFFEGEGICIPSEYERVAHLNSVVLEDIIDWIGKL